jgi:hypothetical protein
MSSVKPSEEKREVTDKCQVEWGEESGEDETRDSDSECLLLSLLADTAGARKSRFPSTVYRFWRVLFLVGRWLPDKAKATKFFE